MRTLRPQGSVFHRVQPGGWVQGGDIVTGAGDGSRSVYVASANDCSLSVFALFARWRTTALLSW
jgi:cyclophilin family peptidyl-prolyl cis-trans isomerase